MKEVMIMANKKTVVQMYEEILALPGLNDEQKAFITKRIEITKKKNAGSANGELTPKQKEKLAKTEELKSSVLRMMVVGVSYSPSELVKLVGNEEIPNTQKLTPLLTALVEDKAVVKTTEKGRSKYALPAETADEGE
jgi:hypothetical protein